MISFRCGSAFAKTSHTTYYIGDIVENCSFLLLLGERLPGSGFV
jgi:hypothetical protein